MSRFETTKIWQHTLATQTNDDQEKVNREKLRTAFEKFRERAAVLAGEISRDLPDFTVHDITHIDALWEMADIITGDKFELTPAEGFVLGGAFLIHDLGMGLAAFPNGVKQLREEPLWNDTVAALLKDRLDRTPTPSEIQNPGTEIETQTTAVVLRQLHAKQAEMLALVSWEKQGTQFHLIEDTELRDTYGPIIGLIAHSHWWPIDQLEDKFPRVLPAPGGYSAKWTVDALKLACIIRAADASHLDERRAPSFLQAIRRPSGFAKEHWDFQQKLYQPRPEGDRLLYASKSSFTVEQASSWWLCYDALQVVDSELRQVDALLADKKKTQLAVRGVLYVEDPQRLATLVSTDGWQPVDTKIHVGDVARLVSNLGGEQLYGNDVSVPLRELIQNASDAVRARRALQSRPNNWGEICVRTGKDELGNWIEVEDNGIGMSVNVLTGPFLDFGTSFWRTELMHTELPGLETKEFQSTGRYGIGFFSVFMWGNCVQVTTKRVGKSDKETLVLQFNDGASSRPLLREANSDEQLLEGGTRVRVWTRDPHLIGNLLSGRHEENSWTLVQKCAWLCPALDVDLFAEDKANNKKRLKVLSASDWLKINGSLLLKRIVGPSKYLKDSGVKELIETAGSRLRILKDDKGNIVGRACIHTSTTKIFEYGIQMNYSLGTAGVVTVGGARTSNLSRIAGVLIGKSSTAARDLGIPIVDSRELSRWATEQVSLFGSSIVEQEYLVDFAMAISACYGDTAGVPLFLGYKGWSSASDIVQMNNIPDEILIIHDAGLRVDEHQHGAMDLYANVFAVAKGTCSLIAYDRRQYIPLTDWPLSLNYPSMETSDLEWPNGWDFSLRYLESRLVKAIAESWKIPIQDVLRVSEKSTDSKRIEREVGMRNGKPVTMTVDVIRRPINKTK